ncbi:putative desmoplakin isoform X1 [Apostichopus japonicus]|uniref:Putative desmoplakin isoform X1 n=1 Tax=Stichopus japonicus TaxID=307972 RepID=A0A2G8KJ49_STIJA|nr:putative desmoplakin isoform X1 [Apostichopus japonicus]
MATQTLDAVTDLEKDGKLTEEQSQQYLDRIRKDVQAAKEKYEINRAYQQAALHKKLTQLKKEKLVAKEREQAEALAKFESEEQARLKHNERDPQVYMDSKLTLLSSHQTEKDRLSNQLDEEATEELNKMESELVDNTKQEIEKLKQGVYAQLMQNNGLTESMKNEILEQHARNLEQLEEERQEARTSQERDIKSRLGRLKKDLATRKQQEKEEQEQIRHYEENMVNKLLATQVAVSEEERRKIMEEYEKNLITSENSLALSKMRQQRLLEEKVAKMRARQMDKLDKKHQAETRRQMRSRQLERESGESEDETEAKDKGDLMKKQAEEKLNLMSSVSMDLDDDLEAVRVEMLQERAIALQRQEERLGRMMAQLQLDKAREMATIEEQQKALLQLKLNMFDEMTEKGVMKNSQATKVIEAHQKSLQNLEKKVSAEREKQEAALKKRLREKMMEREKSLDLKHENELRLLAGNYSNSTVVRLRRVAMKHKHMKQREQFRNKMDVEITQTLEESRRQFDVQKLQLIHKQEVEFLAALAKFGEYSEAEMKNVLILLFPTEGEEKIVARLKDIFDEERHKKEENEDNSSDSKKNPIKLLFGLKKGKRNTTEGDTLEEKVKKAIMASRNNKSSDGERDKRRSSLAKVLKKGKLAPLNKEEDHVKGSSISPSTLPKIQHQERPEPLGRAQPQFGSDQESEEEDEDEDDESDGDGRMRNAVLL